MERVIMVLQAGWVLYAERDPATPTAINNAYVITRWGTTKGLAELAAFGPTPNTLLSEKFDGTVPVDSVLFTINVSPSARWP